MRRGRTPARLAGGGRAKNFSARHQSGERGAFHPTRRNAAHHGNLAGALAAFGFDFVLDDEDCAWFVECNPRPIPIVHLGARVGVDLCRRFRAELAGEPPSVEKIPGEEIVVAHFPKELRRDPQSEWLQRALHDVPTDDPELMAALLAESTPRNQG